MSVSFSLLSCRDGYVHTVALPLSSLAAFLLCLWSLVDLIWARYFCFFFLFVFPFLAWLPNDWWPWQILALIIALSGLVGELVQRVRLGGGRGGSSLSHDGVWNRTSSLRLFPLLLFMAATIFLFSCFFFFLAYVCACVTLNNYRTYSYDRTMSRKWNNKWTNSVVSNFWMLKTRGRPCVLFCFVLCSGASVRFLFTGCLLHGTRKKQKECNYQN